MALPMNVSGLRRNIKNIAHNYTDAQVKVREATSNDPWGPSSTIMSEIADLTYNVVAFSEIMQMVWKRLNDHGKNWRHVYKALVLLEYLIKTGSEKVAEQSRENIHSISTLKDFQYIEEGKDQGINVREKAKAMVTLLKDDERLRNERVRALKAKERFAQSVSGIASDADINSPTSPSYHDTFVTSSQRTEREAYGVRDPGDQQEGATTNYGELESARPHTLGEEELQLQLALAMSKEEADHEEARRRSDDVRLQMALTESKDEKPGDEPLFDGRGSPSGSRDRQSRKEKDQPRSGINDLLDINFNPPHQQLDSSGLGAVGGLGLGSPVSPPAPSRDPWGLSPPALTTTNGQADPWSGVSGLGGGGAAAAVSLPTSPPTVAPAAAAAAPSDALNDPWAPPPPPPQPAAIPSVNDPWAPAPVPPPADPWSPAPTGAVPKGGSPVAGATPPPPAQHDPFAPLSATSQPPADEFSALTNREKPAGGDGAFSLSALEGTLPPTTSPPPLTAARASPAKSRSPAAFLGENSNLVNLDNLVATKGATPYGMEATSALSTSFPNLNALLSTPNNNTTANNNALNLSTAYAASSSNAINAYHSDNLLAINNNNNNFAAISPTNPFGSAQAAPASISYNFNNNMNNSLENFGSAMEGSPATNIQRPYSAVPLSFSPSNPSSSSPLPPLSQASFPGANPFSLTGGTSAFGSGVNASVGGGASAFGGGANASVGGASAFGGGANAPASAFGGGATGNVPNPFQAAQSPKPSINQLRATTGGGALAGPWGAAPTNNVSGLDALSSQHSDPFLL